ncbi:MAG TPA: HAD family hydrolase [Candidatus Acidoferrales bacterium]|nr:HAD family hydrolase [Candidatus Acidoferrales bacterium]
MGELEAVLLDVGGTLWSDRLPPDPMVDQLRAARLADLVPELTVELALLIVQDLNEQAGAVEEAIMQDTDGSIRESFERTAPLIRAPGAAAVRKALCLPARGRLELFPGTLEALAKFKDLHLRCVVVSNGFYRDHDNYLRLLEELGVARYLDGLVSSVDTGFRKPHPAIFEAALKAANAAPDRCVMVGDNERKDIRPAVAFGMRAIRVAIQEPRPAASDAHAVVTSLPEAASILEAWVKAPA